MLDDELFLFFAEFGWLPIIFKFYVAYSELLVLYLFLAPFLPEFFLEDDLDAKA